MASTLAQPAFQEPHSKLPPNHYPINSNASPPPECPMHQKDQPKPTPVYVSECPVKHDPKDINPLNMVNTQFPIKAFKFSSNHFQILDASSKSATISWPAFLFVH
jgi:hypothetical protein